jgi:predicted PurR-regulated permease PerM
MTSLPETIRAIEWKLRDIKSPIDQVTEATQQVEAMAGSGAADAATSVTIREQSYAELLLSSTQSFLISAAVVVVLLYMLLASGDLFLHKLVKVQPQLKDKKLAVEIVRQVKHDVSLNLLTITAINIGLGIVISLAMFALRMPNPVLWGLMAAGLNFIPYFGAVVGVAVTALVAFASFEQSSAMILPPLVYAACTAIEGYVVTPLILGARLSLNPVVIVVGLLFWGWLWGIPGAVLAVPLLIIIKALCDRITGLQAIGEFLGR